MEEWGAIFVRPQKSPIKGRRRRHFTTVFTSWVLLLESKVNPRVYNRRIGSLISPHKRWESQSSQQTDMKGSSDEPMTHTHTKTEEEGKGRQVNKTSPRIHHYLAMDIEYQMQDRRHLHICLLLLKMTNTCWREKDRERKRDGWDMESDGDWHSIFLNSNPITSPEFPYG